MSLSNVGNTYSGGAMEIIQPSGVVYLSSPQTGVSGSVTTLHDFDSSYSYSGNFGDYFDLSSTGLLICKQPGIYDFNAQIIYNTLGGVPSGVFKQLILQKVNTGQNFCLKTNQVDLPDANWVGLNANTWTSLAVGDQVGLQYFQGAVSAPGQFEQSSAPSGLAGSALWWSKIN